MKCPECGKGSEVVNSRLKGWTVRRRRRCLNEHRFTTFEVVQPEKVKPKKDRMSSAQRKFLLSMKDGDFILNNRRDRTFLNRHGTHAWTLNGEDRVHPRVAISLIKGGHLVEDKKRAEFKRTVYVKSGRDMIQTEMDI